MAGASAAVAPRMARATDALPIVNAGVIPSDVSAVIAYALELGYFRSVGLDVRLTVMSSGPVVAAAVVGGALDVGAINTGSLAIARAHGLPLEFFAPAAITTPALRTDLILVRPDSPIRTAAEVNNKTVALAALKTLQHAAFLQWMDNNGGDSKTPKFIEIPFSEMVGALDQGRIDVAVPSEPFASAASATHRVIGSVWSSMPPRFMIFGIAATEGWLGAHPDLAMKFAAATRRAAVWANGHPRESADMLARLIKVDPSLAKTMAGAVYGISLDAAMIQPALDVLAKYGFLEKTLNPNELIWQPLAHSSAASH